MLYCFKKLEFMRRLILLLFAFSLFGCFGLNKSAERSLQLKQQEELVYVVDSKTRELYETAILAILGVYPTEFSQKEYLESLNVVGESLVLKLIEQSYDLDENFSNSSTILEEELLIDYSLEYPIYTPYYGAPTLGSYEESLRSLQVLSDYPMYAFDRELLIGQRTITATLRNVYGELFVYRFDLEKGKIVHYEAYHF